MVKTEEREIDDLQVSVLQFPARFGFKLQIKLARIFGPVLGEILSGIDKKKVEGIVSKKPAKTETAMDRDIDLSKISGAIETLFNKLDEDSSMKLVFELLQSTRIGGQEINDNTFDEIFAAKYLTLYKVIGFVLEVNYRSFFVKGSIGMKLKGLVS